MGKQEKAIETRDKILQAAIKEFGEKGYRQGSTNAICEALGVSKGIIFYHFGSKEQLYKEAVWFCMNEFNTHMQETFTKGNTPLEEIRACCYNRKKFFVKNLHYFRIFSDVLYGGGQVSDVTKDVKEAYEKHSFDILNRILENVELNKKIKREESVWMAVRIIELIDRELGSRYQGKTIKPQLQEKIIEEQMEYYEGYLESLLYGLLKR